MHRPGSFCVRRWPARCIEARYENGKDDEHPACDLALEQRLPRQLASRFRTAVAGGRAECSSASLLFRLICSRA
jgi:hypothetical protein